MWNGFIGQHIATTTRTLRRTGIALLLLALVIGLFGAKKLMNVIRGPAQLDETQLAALSSSTFVLRDYATVHGRNTITTGITWMEKTTRNGVVESQRTTADFMAMIVGKHILIVKAKPGVKSERYTGAIVPVPIDVKQRIVADMSDPELEAVTLPVMLDASEEYNEDLIPLSVIVVPLLLLSFWALSIAKRRQEDPERHPICKSLSEYGPLYTLVPQIDADAATATSTIGGATFTPNWVIYSSLTKSFAISRQEIVWVYKKRTRHSVNFIPTGSTYALILRDARGKLLELSGSEQTVDSYLASLQGQTPWVIFGYDRKLEKLYKKQRPAFVEAVTERK